MRKWLPDSNWEEEYMNLAIKPDEGPEELWKSLKSMILDLRNRFIPIETTSDKPTWKSRGSVPINKETRNAIKLKEKYHRVWMDAKKRGECDPAKEQYTMARNKVKTLRKAKRRFQRGIALEAKSNPKGFWSHTRRYLKPKSGVASLLADPKDKDSMKFDDVDKAAILLKQFSSVFTQEASARIPGIEKRTEKVVKDLHITEDMVLKELKSINKNKSCGPDQLHPRLLIELLDHIAAPVTRLFNSTLKTGVLPVDWKRAFITPISKKGSRHLPENYRPISLTAILYKIVERFVQDQVVTHLLEEKLLSNKQYGFIAGRSTITQLLLYLLHKKVANGDVVESIYLDFSKAFDTVPHRKMLGKLEAYGIRGNSLSWIKGFLYDRTQEVVVNGTKSEPASVISGIPTGYCYWTSPTGFCYWTSPTGCCYWTSPTGFCYWTSPTGCCYWTSPTGYLLTGQHIIGRTYVCGRY